MLIGTYYEMFDTFDIWGFIFTFLCNEPIFLFCIGFLVSCLNCNISIENLMMIIKPPIKLFVEESIQFCNQYYWVYPLE